MIAEYIDQRTEIKNVNELYSSPLVVEVRSDRKMAALLGSLSPDVPWGERQKAAKKLGYMRCQTAVPVLIDVLPTDPFWMVRCSIIQALERISDPAAIPTLREVAKRDRFQVVRSHATKAIGILAKRGNGQNGKNGECPIHFITVD